MINNVVLVGRLTKDVDLRYTSNGTAVASFTLAVNRQYTNQSGEREADFINCVAWRKTAETLANFTKKGSLVGVEGRIQTRNYENQQGQRVYVTEVVANTFTMLESKSVTDQRRTQDSGSSNSYDNRQQSSYNQNRSQSQQTPGRGYQDFGSSDPFEKSSQPIDISDDDLPF
ncbi:single-stranded DNA-binding protein [Pisciglobus halotolerans]|uniref:Single-stranded DNA-binding protein n=1 Tax=Pisciglobus halotolerans TaxID=745365 RepID=A0A1I3D5M4_9LACT|nr:single-stranded DNA-binding protein [Pisciglobus halotolerans]SFH81888.1 single-strand DNA-binding protein [Pisciglobus halotolerans]